MRTSSCKAALSDSRGGPRSLGNQSTSVGYPRRNRLPKPYGSRSLGPGLESVSSASAATSPTPYAPGCSVVGVGNGSIGGTTLLESTPAPTGPGIPGVPAAFLGRGGALTGGGGSWVAWCFAGDTDESVVMGENSGNSAPWPGAYLTFSPRSDRLFSGPELDSVFVFARIRGSASLNRSHREGSRAGGVPSSLLTRG
jgi:hypothetical protein